jgi:hypothetical protein
LAGSSTGAGDGAQGIIRLQYNVNLSITNFRSPSGGVVMGGSFTY